MALPEQISAFCPYYHQATELIGRRWTGAILRALRSGVHRFSDLTASIPDLSDRMLSERLKGSSNVPSSRRPRCVSTIT
jgi:DNA-binding HxlR family transcriptional regulator